MASAFGRWTSCFRRARARSSKKASTRLSRWSRRRGSCAWAQALGNELSGFRFDSSMYREAWCPLWGVIGNKGPAMLTWFWFVGKGNLNECQKVIPREGNRFGYGSKLSNQKTAGFSPCFHLPSHFGVPRFLSRENPFGPNVLNRCPMDLRRAPAPSAPPAACPWRSGRRCPRCGARAPAPRPICRAEADGSAGKARCKTGC